MKQDEHVLARIRSLESQVRGMRVVLGIMTAAGLIATLGAWRMGAQDVIRTRQIIVEDDQGRERMRIGPQSDFGGQRSPSMGMTINDTVGMERFGMGLRANGRMSMGFDAPPGKGDDRNRERINIIADEEGGAQIRFLDRKTYVKGRIQLADDNRIVLTLLDVSPGETRRRMISVDQDTVVIEKR